MTRIILLLTLITAGCSLDSPPQAADPTHDRPKPVAQQIAVLHDKPLPEAFTLTTRSRVLFDFERPADVARWRPSNTSTRPERVIAQKFTAEPAACMRFELNPGTRYPGILLRSGILQTFDWSDGQYLRFDMWNDQDYPITLHARLDSKLQNGRDGRSTHPFTVWPGINRVKLPFARFGEEPKLVNAARVSQLIIFAIQPPETLRFYLDNFRLESDPEVHVKAHNAVLLDFGTPESSVMPGFSKITEDALYTEDTGVGFTTDPQSSHIAPHYSIDSLIDDYVSVPHNQRAEFRIDVPDGKYTVALWMRGFGQMDRPMHPWSLRINGALRQLSGVSQFSFYSTTGYYRGYEIDYCPQTDVWDEFVKHHVPEYLFDVEARDGSLRFSFESVSVYALALWPAEEADWGKALLRQVEQMRRSQFLEHNFWMQPYEPPQQDVQQPVISPVSYMHDIPPNMVPAEPAAPARGSAARGETITMAFAFRTPVEYEAIQAAVEDIEGEAGVIPSKAIDLRLARLFPRRRDGGFSLMNVMLEPAGGQTIRPFVTRLFVADVKVPHDTAPGVYRGRFTISTRGRKPLAAEFEINVRSFSLPEELPAGFGAYCDLTAINAHYRHFFNQKRMDDMISEQLHNMREHGFNTLSTRMPRAGRFHNGTLELDFVEASRMVALFHQHGIAAKHPAPLPMHPYYNRLRREGLEEFSPQFNRAFKELCASLVEWAAAESFPILLYMVDEPREIGLDRWHRNLADTIRYLELARGVPGARTYVTVTSDSKHGKDYTTLAPFADVIAAHPTQNSAGLISRARELCLYNGGRDRLSWGFHVWRTGARHRHEWAYQWFNLPYNPLDPTTSWAFAYPSPRGLLPTLDQKRIRKGIDDYRYIHLLEQLIEQAGAEDAAPARKLLMEIRAQVPEFIQKGNLPDLDMDAWRNRIADEIERLSPGQ